MSGSNARAGVVAHVLQGGAGCSVLNVSYVSLGLPSMPGKKNNNKPKGKGKNGGKQKDTRPPLAFRPMPNLRVNVLFRHERTITETAAGAGGVNWYRINGCFDPDQSGTGTTPLGYNNYATLFTMYRVVSMRIKVVASGVLSSTPALGVVTLLPNPYNVIAPSDPALWGGEYMASSTPIALGNTGGKNVITLDRTYLPWKLIRVPKDVYMADLDYASQVTTTPTKQCYVAVGINSVGTGVTATLSTIVTISYEVEFFEPAML